KATNSNGAKNTSFREPIFPKSVIFPPHSSAAGGRPATRDIAVIRGQKNLSIRKIFATLGKILRRNTTQRLLRRSFLDSIRSGTLCAAIPLSKNSARKSTHERPQLSRRVKKSRTLTSR